MNKCAGVFVKDFIRKHYKTKIKVYKHSPVRCIRESDRGKIKIGIIRNPFEWYVSFFHYHKENGYYPKMNFEKYVKLHLENSRKLISKAQKKNVLDKNAKIYPPHAHHLNIGSCTFHYIHFFSYNALKILREWTDEKLSLNWENVSNMDVLMTCESLRNDMIGVFGEEYRKELESAPKKNTTKHKHYREYYSPELRKLVEKKDGILLNYYGYKF
jgi:hypothetical protein